jgi:Leucine-rich repeat (LRR) protein
MCSQLEKLPKHIGNMECLRGLLADGTSIKQLPLSIVFFKKLEKLSLCGRNYDKLDSPSGPWHVPFSSWFSPRNTDSKTLLPVSFGCLTSLRELDISYHGLSEGSISVAFESLSALRRLDLSGNKFLYMPFGIGGIPKLEILLVVNCKNLQSIAELPSSLLL